VAKPALVAIGALLLVGGAGAIGYGVTRHDTGGMTPQASSAMMTAVDALDGDIKAARASVKVRAATFAGLQPVQAVVATDAATAKDMLSRGELKFDVQPGEVIEVGQVPNGADPMTLLIQPDGAMHGSHAGKAGSYAELMGNTLVVTEVAEVTPKVLADKLTGYVMVSRPLDLAPEISKLASAGLSGKFQLGASSIAVGQMPAGAMVHEEPLPSQPDVKLVVAVPPTVKPDTTPALAGGGAGALVGLILLIAGMVRKKQGVSPALVPPQTVGTAATQLSQPGVGVASGTPSPVGASGVALSPTTNLGPGAMVGRWEILKRLGSGGMADVYLAHSRGEAGFEKQVAIKIMHPHLARNERAVEHFLDEARLASRISHPNVVQIQDLGKIGNDYVIVMEYVEGVDLERLLASARFAQRQVPIDVGLAILCRICDGLNAAHKSTASDGTPLNLIHRDVKSANVLVSKQGGVKVVDFGIAKAAKQSHMTVAGETKGTPSMMAPEQRVGEQVDVRADVYATAAVGYEIMTGHGVNLDLAALAHLGVENWPHLPPPSSLRPQLPPELDKILLGAMAFERDKRPADCAELETTLEQLMKKHGLTASDKDIARWVQAELAQLSPLQPATDATVSPSIR
jgi:tRNA A-37 threonylcarbamoyl transferase component Bud32